MLKGIKGTSVRELYNLLKDMVYNYQVKLGKKDDYR